ncbi:MAG: ABC-type transport auxiliary lipoprotein family protein [Pseudomonadota bacterium]
MKNIIRRVTFMLALTASALLVGCATKQASTTLYDLGPLRAAQSSPALPAVSIAEAHAPAWLDSQMMFYRLAYANDQQPRPYATSRWNTPPVQLFVQRLKSRIGQAGGIVLAASDGAANMPVLRIDADDFTQVFDRPGQSHAQVRMRVSVLNGRTLLAQKTFTAQAPAATADAPGGARALADASETIITDMMAWLAGLPLKK